MTFRRVGAMDMCEARTQGARVAALRARLRTQHRAVQCVQSAEISLRNELLEGPGGLSSHDQAPDEQPKAGEEGAWKDQQPHRIVSALTAGDRPQADGGQGAAGEDRRDDLPALYPEVDDGEAEGGHRSQSQQQPIGSVCPLR